MERFLIIQTSSLGDVILATAVLEELHARYPSARIDFFLREGQERLFEGHPFLNHLWVWNHTREPLSHLLELLWKIRRRRYDAVINLQRSLSTGFLTAFSRGRKKAGFSKAPFSWFYNIAVPDRLERGKHEAERLHSLIGFLGEPTGNITLRLFPREQDIRRISSYQSIRYITVSPATRWFTRQFPVGKWAEFIRTVPADFLVYFLGAGEDVAYIHDIMSRSRHPGVINLAGKLSLLESAALMQGARMNFTNDAAPLHLCTAVNAPVSVVYCASSPALSQGILFPNIHAVEAFEDLHCRPCAAQGLPACPQGHFRCALSIKKEQLLETIGL